jgi:hypothetical protein
VVCIDLAWFIYWFSPPAEISSSWHRGHSSAACYPGFCRFWRLFLVYHSFQFMDFWVLWLTWIWKCFRTSVLFGRPCIPTFVISAEAAYVTSCEAHEIVCYILWSPWNCIRFVILDARVLVSIYLYFVNPPFLFSWILFISSFVICIYLSRSDTAVVHLLAHY